jgi:hypothetical protein
MANIHAVHSVGSSIATYLRNAYATQPGRAELPECDFAVMSSGEMAAPIDDATRISLYLYRVTVNEYTRQSRPGIMAASQPPPLAWAMRQLYLHPVLDASSLSPEAAWGPDEVIQMIPAELSNEDMMRIWDALEPAYRLSVSYIARMVRIDPDGVAGAGPVLATRFGYGTASPGARTP